MKLNQVTNLRVEDFPDQSKWIGGMFLILNSFITSVSQIINQNVDFATNIKSITKDFDPSTLTYPVRFQWTFPQSPPASLQVCVATKDNVPVVILPAWSYDSSKEEIAIYYFTELSSSGSASATSPSARYKFTIRATV